MTVAETRLAIDLAPTHFQGREVAAGVAPVRIARGAQLTVPRLLREAINTGELVAAVVAIRDRIPGAAEATAGQSSAPIEPDIAREIADRLAPFASRPVHLAFVKAALGSLGLWTQIEHATASDGRSLGQLDDAATAQAERFGAGSDLGGYKPDQILARLKPKQTGPSETTYTVTGANAVAIIHAIAEIDDPEGRGAALKDLDDHGVLESVAKLARPADVERLHAGLPPGEWKHVRTILRQQFEGRDTSDNSMGSIEESIPWIGGALHTAHNFATFGFLDEHDAAYRAMRAGELTEAEFQQRTGKALLRAGVVGAVSYATGGAAGAYAEGLTGSLAARGVVGRIAANTVTGAAAGSAGAVGARLGSDAVDGRLSSAGDLAHDALVGGAIGGGLGAGLTTVGAAGARYLPAGARTWLQKLAAQLPHEAEIFDRLRDAGRAHNVAIRIRVARLLQLGEELEIGTVRGTVAIASADGGPPLGPDDEVIATLKATRALDDETATAVDGPAPIAVLKVERLPEESISTPGDDLPGAAVSTAPEPPAASARAMTEGDPTIAAEPTSATAATDAEIATAARTAAARARVIEAVGDVPIGSLPSDKGRPSYFITRADGAALRGLLAQLDEVRLTEFPRGLTIHRNGRDWFLEWAPESGACAPAFAGARDAATVGLPPPNASLVLFYGFRGLQNVDGVFWKKLPAAERAFVERMFAEDPLLRYGHVGVSFDGGRTIQGLTPPIKGTATLTPEMVKERVESHIPVPGIIGDDTATFDRARRMAALGWDLEITEAAQSLNEATVRQAFNLNDDYSTPGAPHGKQYAWPYEQPNELGAYYPDANTRNCATYPEMLGLRVPEPSGQLRDYIPELKQWATESPIDLRSGGSR